MGDGLITGTPEPNAPASIGNMPPAVLHERRLVLLRLVWLLTAGFSVVHFIAALPAAYDQVRMVCADAACADDIARLSPTQAQTLHELGFSLEAYAFYTVVLAVLSALVWWTVGSIIFWRTSHDRMAFLVAFFFMLAGSSTTIADALVFDSAWWLPVQVASYLSSVSLVGVFLLFPDGRWVPRWTRWLALIFAISEFFYHFEMLLPPSLHRIASTIDTGIWPVSLFAIVIAQAYRYRRVSGPAERQQTKWVVFGLAVGIVGLFVFLVPAELIPALANSPYGLAGYTMVTCLLLLIPLSFGVAILRSRLWDIDLLINRALVYAVLTVILAVVYVAVVVVLQRSVQAVTGDTQSAAATVASTLTIATLFQPLRRRVQHVIDRRFYRRRYSTRRTLEAFGAKLRNQTDLPTLTADLITVVQDTLQPAHVSLWLCEPPVERHR